MAYNAIYLIVMHIKKFILIQKLGYYSKFSMRLQAVRSDQLAAIRNPFHPTKQGYIKDKTVNPVVKSNILSLPNHFIFDYLLHLIA